MVRETIYEYVCINIEDNLGKSIHFKLLFVLIYDIGLKVLLEKLLLLLSYLFIWVKSNDHGVVSTTIILIML
jgi:hypothetical protein